jgi:uncharacterized protein DUF6603
LSGTFTYAELQKAVAAAAAAIPFQLGGSDLQSSAISNLLTSYLGLDKLAIALNTQPDEGGTSITVAGTFQQQNGWADRMAATAVFSVADGTAHVALTLAPEENWSPSKTFLALSGSAFDAFAWSGSKLLLDSTGANPLPSDFPAEFGWPKYEPAPVFQPGFSLSSNVALRGDLSADRGLGHLAWAVAAGKTIPVSGPIVTQPAGVTGAPSILLNGELGNLFIGPFTGDFSLQIGSIRIGMNKQNIPRVFAPVQVSALVVCQTHGAPTVKFKLAARVDVGVADLLSMSLTPDADCPITVDDLAGAVAGLLGVGSTDVDTSWLDQLPVLHDIGLQSGALTVALPRDGKSPSILQASFTLALKIDKPWMLFDGVEIDNLFATFTAFPGVEMKPMIVVEADATVGSAKLAARFSAPAMSFEVLLEDPAESDTSGPSPPQTVDMSGPLAGLTSKPLPDWMSAKQADTIHFVGSWSQHAVANANLTASFQDHWSIPLDGVKLSLDTIVAGLQYTREATPCFTGGFSATLTVAGEPIAFAVDYDNDGWTFQGGTGGPIAIPIGEFVDKLINELGLSSLKVENLPLLTLLSLNASYTTGGHQFTLRGYCSADSESAGKTMDDAGKVSFGVEVIHDAPANEPPKTDLKGYLWIGENAFELDFQMGSTSVFAGKWRANEAGGGLDLSEIISSLVDSDYEFIPQGIDLKLTGANIIYDFTQSNFVLIGESDSYGEFVFICSPVKGGGYSYGFLAKAAVSISLAELPAVGPALAQVADLSISDLQISVVDQGLGSQGPAFNQLLDSMDKALQGWGIADTKFPAVDPKSGTRVLLTGSLDTGSGKVPLQLPIVGKAASSANLRPMAAAASSPQDSSSGGTVWLDVQKTFGPVSFRRIGLRFRPSDQFIWFEMDAGLALGPLAIDLAGLGIGSPISKFSPCFALDGLGLAFDASGVEITGGLQRLTQGGNTTYDGAALIKFQDIAIAAFGSYAEMAGGGYTLFIFADLNKALGGPACFYVTGLSAGFGYDRTLTIPAQDNVQSFPLVAGLSDPSRLGGDGASLSTVLATMEQWLPVEPGEYWLAAGVQFTTFKIINTNALLVVEFGKSVAIAVLGVSTLKQPSEGETYVYAEIDIEALVLPDLGEIQTSAVLSSSSYVLTRDAHLTGGFAFYAWFGGNEHEGDFVFTIGGYHPAFQVPAHYPREPRLGINWQIGDGLAMVGTAYFAITPATMMAGAAIRITYEDGNLNAWLSASVDVLLYWSPFYVIGDAYISVGVSYRLDLLFTHVTLSVEIGADFNLWGPPVGGTVHIDWYIISFTIGFGADLRGAGDLSWGDFSKLLPTKSAPHSGTPVTAMTAAAADNSPQPVYLSILPNAGLSMSRTAYGYPVWLVRAGKFQFSIASAVPASEFTLKNPNGPKMPDAKPVGILRVNGGIAPADYNCPQTFAILTLPESVDAKAIQAFTVTPGGDVIPPGCENNLTDVDGWLVSAVEKNMPQAMWGDKTKSDSGQSTVAASVGILMQPAPPDFANGTPTMEIDAIFTDAEINSENDQGLPLSSTAAPAGNVPSTAGSFKDIAAINSDPVASARLEVYKALQTFGFDPGTNDTLSRMQASPGKDFADEPMEGIVAA